MLTVKITSSLAKDPQERPFADIKRNADGTLPDDALVEILTSSIEDVAGKHSTFNLIAGYFGLISNAFRCFRTEQYT